VTLTQAAPAQRAVPQGAKFTPQQYESFKAGNLYVNVHGAARIDGEIRLQLKP
jgi:CHRD domain